MGWWVLLVISEYQGRCSACWCAFLFSSSYSVWRDTSSGSLPNKWVRLNIWFWSSLACDSCHEPIMRVQGRMTFTFTHLHTNLTQSVTHTVYAYTYPELPRERLAVTQCNHATFDLPGNFRESRLLAYYRNTITPPNRAKEGRRRVLTIDRGKISASCLPKIAWFCNMYFVAMKL